MTSNSTQCITHFFINHCFFFTGVVVTPIVVVSLTFLMNEKYPCVLYWFWLTLFSAVSLISIFILALISSEKYLVIMHTYYYERVVTRRKRIRMTIDPGNSSSPSWLPCKANISQNCETSLFVTALLRCHFVCCDFLLLWKNVKRTSKGAKKNCS